MDYFDTAKKYRNKRIKKLRSKLKRRVVSSWSQISDPNLTEILCHKKFDCLTFDLEHGIFNIKDLICSSSAPEQRTAAARRTGISHYKLSNPTWVMGEVIHID